MVTASINAVVYPNKKTKLDVRNFFSIADFENHSWHDYIVIARICGMTKETTQKKKNTESSLSIRFPTYE